MADDIAEKLIVEVQKKKILHCLTSQTHFSIMR